MITKDSPPLPPPSIPLQEKGSRNKRKFRADSSLSLPNTLPPSFNTDDLPEFDLFPVDNAPEISNFDYHPGVCDMCRTVICTSKDEPDLEEFHDADWSDLTALQLEEVLLSNLDMAYKTAIKMITSYGYSESVAINAVLSVGVCYGCKDTVSNIVENALALLRSGQEVDTTPREHVSVVLGNFGKSILGDMINVVREVRPFLNISDAMWWLLMSDMNVSHACAMDSNTFNSLCSDETPGSCSASQFEMGSNQVPHLGISDPSVPGPEKPNLLELYSPSSPHPDVSSAMGFTSLPYGRFPISNNSSKVTETNIPKEGLVPSSNHIDESSHSTASRSVQEEKPVSTRKVHVSGSKREAILRQKSLHFEKSYRALGSKAVLRARKHGGLGGLVKCKTISETTSITLKGSSVKLSKGGGMDKTLTDANLDHSFSFGHSSGSPCNNKKISNRSPTSVANTELSLSLSTSNGTGFNAIQDSITDLADGYASMCSEKMCRDWIPEDKKDEMLLLLVPLMRELQAQMQDWNDWVQQKVTQATRRLTKDKAELQTLRQEKEEVGRLQKERQSLEENTKKKLVEMESAISKASGQVERANAAARRLELENAQLRLGMEAAKLQAAESAANCQEVSRKETKTLKTLQSFEREKALLQEELVAEKRKLSQLKQQLEKLEELKAQSEARWRQEEKVKNEALTEANMEKKEREQIEVSAKSQENGLMLKSQNDMQRRKNDIRKLELQIKQLRLVMDTSNTSPLKWSIDKTNAFRISDGRKSINAHLLSKFMDSMDLGREDVQRERECVMCLSEEMSVVFLPCAHQVVCSKCNELHEKQGMKDCPSCRTLIQRRVCVRLADS